MRYDSYVKKMRKVARARNFAIKYKIPLLIALGVIVVAVVSFMSTKGVVTDFEIESSNGSTTQADGSILIEYGGSISGDSNALFSDTKIEYLVEGVWTDVAPTVPGEYSARVTSKNSFGGESHSKEQKIVIGNKKTDVKIEYTEIEYGSYPDYQSVKLDLIGEDKVTAATFECLGIDKDNVTKPKYKVSSVTICDKNGNDVTKYYDLNYVACELGWTPHKINFDIKDLAKVFNNETLTSEDYIINSGSIIDDKTEFKLTYDGSVHNSGNKDAKISVFYEGCDISALYDITCNVLKRDITVLSGSIERVYSGQEVSANTFEITQGELAPGHTLTVKYQKAYIDVCSSPNIQEYMIIDENGHDVTEKYNIETLYGTIVITPYEFNIKVDDSEIEYSATSYTITSFSSTLALEGYEVKVKTTGNLKDVGEIEVVVSEWHVYKDGTLVDQDFNVTQTAGVLKVTPRALMITADDKNIIYGSNAPTYTVSYEGFAEGEDKDKLGGTLAFYCLYNTETSDTRNTGTYEIIPSGYESSNYTISYTNGNLVVAQKTLTVTADAKEAIYGSNAPEFSVSYDGFEFEDTASSLEGTLVYACSYRQGDEENRNVGNYVITPSGYSSNNYAISYVDGSLTINKKELVVTALDKQTTYGSDAPEFTVSYEGFEYEEDNTCLSGELVFTCIYDTTDPDNRGAKDYVITPSGYESDNYEISYETATLTVNKKELVVTALDKQTTYGSSAPEFEVSYTGFEYDETNTNLLGTLVLACSYDIEDVDNRNANDYVITPSGYESDNYEISYETATLTVNKKELVVTALDKQTTYGSDAPEFTVSYEGFEYEEDNTCLSGELVFTCIYDTTDPDNRGAKDYVITPSGYESDNYEISYETATLTVNKKELVVTALDKQTTYGSDAPEFTVSYEGFVYEEDNSCLSGELAFACFYDTTDPDNRGAKDYVITPSGYESDNYYFTYVDASLTVNKKELVVTALDKQTTYGSSAPEFTVSYDGFVYEEDNTCLSGELTFACEYDTADAEKRNVDTYVIAPSGYESDNYYFTYVDASLTVNKKELVVTALDKQTTYGSSAPEFTVTYDGFVYEEDEEYLNGELVFTCIYDTNDPNNRGAKDYVITPSGYESDNYYFTYVDASLTVNKKELVVSANDHEIVYGQGQSNNGVVYSGWEYDDEDTLKTAFDENVSYSYSYDPSDVDKRNVADDYVITPYGLENDNYSFTYEEGTLVVVPIIVTIYTNTNAKVYDGTPLTDANNNYALENASVLPYEEEFVITNTGTITYVGTVDNTYEVSVTNGQLTNYDISSNLGTLTIEVRSVTITTATNAKVYDGTALTDKNYEVTTGSIVTTLDKIIIVSSTSITDVLYNDAHNAVMSKANEFVVKIVLISDEEFNVTNCYDITWDCGTLTVNPATLQVTADDLVATYGDTDIAYTVSYDGFVNGEDGTVLEGTLVFTSTYDPTDSDKRIVGDYVVIPSGYVDGNYVYDYHTGTLTINRKDITVKADDMTITYGDAIPTYTQTVEGFAYDDTVACFLTATTYSCLYDNTVASKRHAGDYLITPASATAQNYNISFENGTLTVNKKELTVTADSYAIVYGESAPTYTAVITGFVYNEDENDLSGSLVFDCEFTQAFAPKRVVGTYEIIPSGLDSNDYSFNYVKGALTVNKKELTVTADDFAITYGTDPDDVDKTVTITGFVYGEDASVLEGSLVYSYTYDITDKEKRNVGNYEVVASCLSSKNYSFKYEKGTLTVNKKALDITVNDCEIVYGEAAPAYTLTYETFAFDDGKDSLTGTPVFTTLYNVNDDDYNTIGDYDVTVSGLTAQNYTITTHKGVLTVNKRPLVIITNGSEKTYDGTALTNANVYVGDTSDYDLVSGHKFTWDLGNIPSITHVLYDANGDVIGIENRLTIYVKSSDESKDYTANYDLSNYTCGDLVINPRYIRVVTMDANKIYDGTSLTNHAYAVRLLDEEGNIINGTGIATGDEILVTFTGTITNVLYDSEDSVIGTPNSINDVYVRNALTLDKLSGEDGKYKDYIIEIKEGTLTINPRPITISTGTYEKMYDGQEFDANTIKAYTITSGSLVAGELASIDDYTNISTVQLDSNNDAKAIDNRVVISIDDNNNSKNYAITYDYGTLKITKRPIVFHTEDATWEYDGEVHKKNKVSDYIIDVDVLNEQYDLVSGHVFAHVNTTTMQDVLGNEQKIDNAISKIVIKDGDEDVTSNYDCTYNPGTLQITRRDLTITVGNQSYVYDGKVHKVDSPENAQIDNLVAYDTLTIVSTGSIKNVGSADIVITSCIIKGIRDDEEVDITNNYDITTNNGTITITPRPIYIESASQSKAYDNKPFDNDNYYEEYKTYNDRSDYRKEEGLLYGSKIVATYDDLNEVNVGVYRNNFSIEIYDSEDNLDSSNYDIHLTNGYLEIIPRPIKLYSEGATKEYDGTPLANSVFTILQGSVVAGQKLVIVSYPSITNVGTVDNRLTLAVKSLDDLTDYTSNYDLLDYDFGELEVTPKIIEFTIDDCETTYDGTVFDNYVASDIDIPGFTCELVYTDRKDAGVYDIEPTIIIKDDQDQVVDNSNYKLVYNEATLTIHKREITIDTDSTQKVYDGNDAACLTYNLTGTIASTDKLIISNTGHSHKDVRYDNEDNVIGYDNDLVFNVVDKNDETIILTKNYDITYNYGEIKILPRPIIISSTSAQKVYDGTPLTVSSWTVADNEQNYYPLVDGHVIKVDSDTSITNVGTVDIDYSNVVILDAYDEDVTSNYVISYPDQKQGSLTITPKDLYIKAKDNTITYGSAASGNGVTYNGFVNGEDASVLEGDLDYIYSYSQDATSTRVVGDYTITPTGITAQNYNIIPQDGKLTVKAKEMHVTTESKEGYYGGPDYYLTYDQFTYANNDLVYGDYLNGYNQARLNYVGVIDSEITLNFIDSLGSTNVSNCYTIVYDSLGTIELKQKPITIIADNLEAVKPYDGTPLQNTSYHINTSLLDGHYVDVVTFNSLTDVYYVNGVVSSINNECLSIVIRDYYDEDVTSNYDISYDLGTLKVTPLSVTITTDSDSKIYDGEELRCAGNDYSDTLLTGHYIQIVNNGSITYYGETGTALNTAEYHIYDALDQEVTSQYTVIENFGTLTIIPRAISVSRSDIAKTYDGKMFEATDVYSITSGTKVAADKLVLSYANNFYTKGSETTSSIALLINDASGNDITSSYDITDAGGDVTFTISKLSVKLQVRDLAEEYDSTLKQYKVVDTIDGTALALTDRISNIESSVKETNAYVYNGNTLVTYTIYNDEFNADVTSCYDVVVIPNTMTINKADLDITLYDKYITYDGKSHSISNSNIQKLITGLKGSDEITSITYVDQATSYVNAQPIQIDLDSITIMNGNNNVTNNYAINSNKSYLFIEKRNITVAPEEVIVDYDGNAHSASEIEVLNGSLAEGDYFDYALGGETLTNKGDSTSSITWLKIYNSQDQLIYDSTAAGSWNYNVSITTSLLRINSTEITLITDNLEKVFDGQPFSASEFANCWTYEGDLSDTDEIIIDSWNWASIQNAYADSNSCTWHIENKESHQKVNSYNLNNNFGAFVINCREVHINTPSANKYYDGTPLEAQGWTFVDPNNTNVLANDRLEITLVSLDHKGKRYNTVESFIIYDEFDQPRSLSYKENYRIIIDDKGLLEVKGLTLNLTSAGLDKEYDEISWNSEAWTYDDEIRLASGDTLVILTKNTFTNICEEKNIYTYKVIDGSSNDVTDNYDINWTWGDVIIRPISISVTADNLEKDYDDTAVAHDVNTIIDYEDKLLPGHYIDITLSDNEYNWSFVSRNSNYNLSNKEMYYKRQYDVIIKVYDSLDNDVTNLYSFNGNTGLDQVVHGNITIYPINLSIRTGSADRYYNDKDLSREQAYLISGELLDGYEIKYTDFTRVKDAGVYENQLTVIICDENDKDIVRTSNYEIDYSYGKLVIRPIIITIISYSADKPYDGTPLTNDEYSVVPNTNTTLASHELIVNIVGTQTERGGSSNTINAKVVDELGNDVLRKDGRLGYTTTTSNYVYTEDNQSNNNYVLVLREGKLTVQSTYIRLEFDDYMSWKTYDGQVFSESGIKYSYTYYENSVFSSLPDGYKVEIEFNNEFEFAKDPGIYSFTEDDYTAYVVDAYGNVKDEYGFAYFGGSYRIYADHEITIAVFDDSYQYDGQEHKTDSSKVHVYGTLADGDYVVVDFLNSLTEIGSVRNDYTYAIYNSNDEDVTSTYDIHLVVSTLGIIGRRLDFYFNRIDHVYDANIVMPTEEDIRYIDGLLPNHHVEDIQFTSNVRDCAYNDGVPTAQYAYVTGFKVYDENDNDVSELYYIVDNVAKIYVSKRPVTFQTASHEKIYDGTALTGEEADYTYKSGLLPGDYYTFDRMTGSITQIGTVKNSVALKFFNSQGTNVSQNYEVVDDEFGDLTVYGRVVISLSDAQKVYDNTNIYAGLLSTSSLPNGYNYTIEKYSDNSNIRQVLRDDEGNVVGNKDYVTNVEITDGQGGGYGINYYIGHKSNGDVYIASTYEYDLNNKLVRYKTVYDENGEVSSRSVCTYLSEFAEDNACYNAFMDTETHFFYRIISNVATLTINPRTIYVYTNDFEATYDGLEHSKTDLQLDINEAQGKYGIVAGHKINARNYVTITDVVYENGVATTIENALALKDIRIMNGMVDVTSNYEVVSYTPGTLKLLPVDLYVSTDDFTKDFDGISFFSDNDPSLYTIYGLINANGIEHDIKDIVFGNQNLSLGEHDMLMLFTIYDKQSDKDVTKNYHINYDYGTLEITGQAYDLGTAGSVGGNGSFNYRGYNPLDQVYFTVTASKTGTYYLRGRSYGDYTGYGFDTNVARYTTGEINPLSYPADGYDPYAQLVINQTSGKYHSYLTTYYDGGFTTLYDDVYVSRDYSKIYELNIPYFFFGLSDGAASEEEVYRQFVYDNYLNYDISDELKAVFDALIYNAGLDANSSSIIYDVRDLIKNSGSFNYTYDYDNNYDYVYYFLNIANEGTSVQFASAATLLYRYLGIPARYVTGFKVEATASKPLQVKDEDGMAWVEVYVDGKGWTAIDPTPSDERHGSEQIGGIPNNGEVPEDVTIFKINTSTSGEIYLRGESFGDYTGTGFEKVSINSLYTNKDCNPLTLPSIALANKGVNSTIQIDMTEGDYATYLVPYYEKDDYSIYNDVYIDGNYGKVYSVDYVANADVSKRATLNGDYATIESNYADYVVDNYRGLNGCSDELLALFASIVSENNFSKNNPDIISEVATYIQEAATYKYEYSIPSDCKDFIYYFLHDSKEGVCSLYSAAATMLYRYLGIPARYVTGVKTNVNDSEVDKWVYVYASAVHAWVEVYIDGFGWMPVEVTGALKQTTNSLVVDLGKQYKIYDGEPIDFDENLFTYNYFVGDETQPLPAGYEVVIEIDNNYPFPSEIGEYTLYSSAYSAYVVDEHGNKCDEYDEFIIKNPCYYRIIEDNQIIINPTNTAYAYDGTFHTLSEFTYQGNLKNGHKIVVNFITKAKDPGTYDVSYTYRIVDTLDNNNEVTSQYDITQGKAVLTIKQRNLQIYFNDIHHIYDGKSVTLGMNDVIENLTQGLLPGHKLQSVSSSDSFKNVIYDDYGNVTYSLAYVTSFKIVDSKDNDVTDYYSAFCSPILNYNSCKIYIGKAVIKIKPVDVVADFDGTVHSASSIEVVEGELPLGYEIEGTIKGSLTYPGDTTTSIFNNSVKVYDSHHNNVTNGYDIQLETGTIVVNKPVIKVSAEYSGVFDAKQHNAELVFKQGSLDENKVYWKYDISGSRTEVGKTDAFVTNFKIYSVFSDENLTQYYDIDEVDGLVEINPYEVTIKPVDREKAYDGEPLTSDDVQYVTPMLAGYYIEIVTDGTVTNTSALPIANKIVSYVVYNQNDEDVTGSFKVNCEDGTLRIVRNTIELTPRNTTRTYNGKSQSADSRSFKSEVYCGFDVTITLTINGSGINVGEYELSIDQNSIVIKDDHGVDVTSQFDIVCNTGTLTIKKYEITIKPEDVVASYNGDEHTPSNYEITSKKKLIAGHQIAYIEYEGSLTLPGEEISSIYENIIIVDEFDQDVTSNYKINFNTGLITVE